MTKAKFLFALLLCLISTEAIMSQTDSVRFYMKVDTSQNGIRVGQDVALRYICNVQYDSVMPPTFSVPVEMVKEAVTHNAGSSVTNGVLTELYEVGFEYIVRFKSEGNHDLPLAAVKVNGKEYQTPPLQVCVQPALMDIEGVECTISIDPEHPLQGERFTVTLTCNRQPDSKKPTVMLDGRKMESSGTAYSAINSIEKFQFRYGAQVAEGGIHVVSVENLTFGGTPYTVSDTAIEMAGGGTPSPKSNDDPSMWLWLAIAGTYVLSVYLALWLRFRKESDEDPVAFVLTHHRLNLNTEWAYTHYGFPLGILMVPFIFTAVNLYDYIWGDGTVFFPLFWCGALPFALAFISYRRQRSKLNFEPIATTLPLKSIQQAIEEVAQNNDWMIDHIDDNCFTARTSRSFPSLSWGEQVFVVFDKGQVWVNSVNDLNKKSVACSFGYPKRNIRLLREAIEKQGKPK